MLNEILKTRIGEVGLYYVRRKHQLNTQGRIHAKKIKSFSTVLRIKWRPHCGINTCQKHVVKYQIIEERRILAAKRQATKSSSI